MTSISPTQSNVQAALAAFLASVTGLEVGTTIISGQNNRASEPSATTFVVMTHRTSVLAVADKMLLLHEGQNRAFGPRDEVLAALAKANAPAPQARAQAPAVAA